MSYFIPKEIPNRCGRCPCFHAEHPMYCQAVKADKNKRIYAPYGEGRPDWCPLIEIPTPHGRLIDADELANKTFYSTTSAPYITYKTFCNAPTIIEAEGRET
jgi:hypothetical protein